MKKETSTGNVATSTPQLASEKLNTRLKENNIALDPQVTISHVNPEVEKAFVLLANQMGVRVNASVVARHNLPTSATESEKD